MTVIGPSFYVQGAMAAPTNGQNGKMGSGCNESKFCLTGGGKGGPNNIDNLGNSFNGNGGDGGRGSGFCGDVTHTLHSLCSFHGGDGGSDNIENSGDSYNGNGGMMMICPLFHAAYS